MPQRHQKIAIDDRRSKEDFRFRPPTTATVTKKGGAWMAVLILLVKTESSGLFKRLETSALRTRPSIR